MTEPLNDNEKDELKALQELRKGAGQGGTQFTDSQRLRLSELQNRAGDAKAEKKAESSGGSTAFGGKK